jgi:hypothetical protein
MIKCTEYRMGRPRTVTDKPLKATRPNDPVYLGAKLIKASSTNERRELVSIAMGDFFYAFGEERKAWKDWLTYEENMNETDWRIV